jgi:hypothetical protein
LANFVGVVGFLNVLIIRLRSLLLAPLNWDSSTYELHLLRNVIRVSLPPRYPLTGCATEGRARIIIFYPTGK